MNRKLFCASFFLVIVFGMVAAGFCKTSKEAAGALPPEKKNSILIVYDNYQVNPHLVSAWGFGCVIRTPNQKIVFDVGGDGSILLSNLAKMNIDPTDITMVIISHIHGDHVGGLNGFLRRNGEVTVYIPASFPESIRQTIISHGAAYQDVKSFIEISETMYSTGEMGTWIKEQSLLLDTQAGTVVITGCAHPGIVNVVKKANQLIPDKSIYLVMGGFHLGAASDSKLKSIIKDFRKLGVKKVAPSHCSGDRCRKLFKEEYRDDYIDSGAGTIIPF